MDNYAVFFVNLPYKVHGFTIHDGCDDFYTIILNSRLSHFSNIETLKHELQHITNNDFIRFKEVNNIETLTHSY
jgi:hypothetical protein